MTTPLISVLIPMYNASAGIRPTLQSIINQTIDDYEVVIVDDGSTDDSVAIALGTFPEARIISQENAGITKALNHGLNHCRGEFIARLDCFDMSLPDRFENQVRAFENDLELGAVGGHMLLYEMDGFELGVCRFPISPEDTLAEILNGNAALPHTGAMIRKDYLLQIGGYDPFYNGREDVELWCRLSLISKLSNLDQIVVRALSTSQGVSYQGVYKYPLIELALIERAERVQKGFQWVNHALREEYSQRIEALESEELTLGRERRAKAIFHLKRAGFLLRSGSRDIARREYYYTIRSNPFVFKAYIGLISARILPRSIYLILLRLYKSVRRVLREFKRRISFRTDSL